MLETGTRIIGPGTGTVLRQATRLAKQYGGDPSDWVEMSSTSYQSSDGMLLTTHWFENTLTGLRIQMKSIINEPLNWNKH
jgi:hypothetical protein